MAYKTVAPGAALDAAAAASYQRARRDGLPAGITSALRTHDEQRALFLARYRPQASGDGPYGDVRTYLGVRYVRVSSQGSVAVPGSTWSRHERGLSLDLPEPARAWMRTHGHHYGWIKDLVPGEAWHFEYQSARDSRPGTLIPLPTDLPEDRMRRTRHTRTKPLALPLGWRTLPINDKGHTSACTTPGRGTLVADLTLTGVPKGREVQVRAIVVESDADGKNAKIVARGSIVEIIGTGGSTFGQIVAPFELADVRGPRQRRVRIQALTLDKGITLTNLTTTVDYIPA